MPLLHVPDVALRPDPWWRKWRRPLNSVNVVILRSLHVGLLRTSENVGGGGERDMGRGLRATCAGFVPRARWDRGGVRGNERPAAMRMALSGRRAQSSREREEVVPDARGCARLSLLRSVAQRPACSGEMKKSLSVFCLPGACRPVPVHGVSGLSPVAREKSRDVVCLRSARRGPGRGLSTDEPGLHTARRGTAAHAAWCARRLRSARSPRRRRER